VVVTYPTKTTNPRKQTKTLLKKHEKIPPRVSQSFEEKTTTSQKNRKKSSVHVLLIVDQTLISSGFSDFNK